MPIRREHQFSMDITSLLNTKTPEPEEVTGSRTTAYTNPPFIEPKPLNILPPLPIALHHRGSTGSQTSPSSQHSTTQIPGLRHTPPREQPPRLLIPPQLPAPMSHIAYPAYAGSTHYTMQQPPMMQSPPSAMIHSAVTDESLDMSGVIKTFPCQGCSKSFARKSDLVRHERIHSGERPHSCDFPGCDKHFIQRSALTVHKRVHTGEKPHKCQSCDKPFSDSSSLARHRRIHSGKRPYKCEVPTCQKTFTRKTTLKRHEQQHNPNRDGLAPIKTESALHGGEGDSQLAHDMQDGEGSTSETSDHATDTSPMSGVPLHQHGGFHDMSSYPGSGPAQYASKALDINSQDSMGPYYRAQAYNQHTAEPRQPGPGPALMTYPPMSSSAVEVTPTPYHTVGLVGETYEAARRPSVQHGISLYPSPEQHTRIAPFPTTQQQHQLTYATHDPKAGPPPQYQPATNDWSNHHQTM